MQALRLWSFWKVLLVSGGWILLCVLLPAVWIVLQFRGSWPASSSGSAGIGAVSFSINVFMLLIPLGPPIVLILAWLIARRS
jgi:hypothetical protein